MNVPDVLEQDWLVAMVDSVVIDAIEVVRMEPMLLSKPNDSLLRDNVGDENVKKPCWTFENEHNDSSRTANHWKLTFRQILHD